jgi:hypothetical protein
MRLKSSLLALAALLFVENGLCQTHRQLNESRETLVYTVNEIFPIEVGQNAVQKGGGDSGGGSGLSINSKLRLKDFAHCPVQIKQLIQPEIKAVGISKKIDKLDSISIKNAIAQNASVSDSLLEKLIWAAAARANWYLVDASLKLSHETDSKLAIFKKPLGILIDADLFSQLPEVDKHGLLFHEALRMISIGFGINLTSSEIETITCKAYSNQPISVEQYPSLKTYFEKLIPEKNESLYQVYKQMWMTTFQSLSDLADIQTLPPGSLKQFFYQLDSSKFEAFRQATPGATLLELESAFFNWAGREVKTNCVNRVDCNYFEEWPLNPFQESRIVKWTLVSTNSNHLRWNQADLKLTILVSKDEVQLNQLDSFCESQSTEKLKFSLASLNVIMQLHRIHKEISLLVNRDNLNSMQDEGLPFVSPNSGHFLLWTPRSDLNSGMAIINDDWNGLGRAFCVANE